MQMNGTTWLPAVRGWAEWSALFTDAAAWRPLVAYLCRRHGVMPARRVEAGYPGTCAVFVVDAAVVVKLYPPMLPDDALRELAVYRACGGPGGLPQLPRLLAHGVHQDRIAWPYLILEYRPGEPIRDRFDELSPAERRALGHELGIVLRRLHATPPAAPFDATLDGWQRRMAANGERSLAGLQQMGFLPAAVLADLADLLAGWVERPSRLCLLNADLTEDHLLLARDRQGWACTALIDWADAELGVPAYEWVALWLGLCRQDVGMFRAVLRAYDPALQPSAAWRRRQLVYTLRHRFGAGIVAAVWRRHGQPALPTTAALQALLWPPFGSAG